MKFGKEFASQMVPEWQEAYMDYNYLKSLLKDIQRFKQRNKSPAGATSASLLKRKMSLYRAFSGLTQRHHGVKISPNREDNNIDHQDHVILVKAAQGEGSEGCYRTDFCKLSDEGGEYELVFLRRLDDELNKVNKFCRSKTEGMLKEAAMLNKQMEAFIAFRIKVEKPTLSLGLDETAEISRLASDVATSAATVTASSPSGARRTTTAAARHMDVIEEAEASNRGSSSEELVEVEETADIISQTKIIHHVIHKKKPNSIVKANRPAPLDVLNQVKIINPLESPVSMLKGVIKLSKGSELNFRKRELKRIQEQLKRVFVEFYHKLRLLKSYSFINLLAFSKIMKKFDKVTSRSASGAYMKVLDNSYLGNSDEVSKLMERVEATFIKHFANSNRSRGMNILRPKAKPERHRVTFSVGYLSGCVTALIVAIAIIIRLRHIIEKKEGTQYMDNMFPLYSLFGFIFLHMVMYAGNIHFWTRYRVNYSFIFGLKQGTELGYREVLLLAFGLAVLALGTVISNLDMEMDQETKDYGNSELLPLGLVILLLVIAFCPFNIIYRSSRFFLLRCAFHCLCAPLYKVTLPDFFLADQLTSQVQAIRSLQFYLCYYIWGDYKHRRNACKQSEIYKVFLYIVAVIPYWCRCLQCIRRWIEEKDRMQGYNALKYFSTVLAVVMRTAYSLSEGMTWRIMAVATSIVSAIVSTYWDLVFDWGLLQRRSKNPWLRDKLLISRQGVYFGAMILNVLLRFAWLQTVLPLKVPFLHREALVAIFASLEIIRRGIWNFFRLENEHLNNVGKYRAFKSVPLPFSYDEDEDRDE
ncbi:PREDICTED: phosphate transporter PHO1 homolog 3-like [Nelumbo nucifera]|uniref:Phosphate transporter PHO1 homolog 3-like n=2 Tax=Nelumbo nucifera TaxID=4432 RepID=A0A822YIK7_NELNU|nr:PREDICTED: phosphate transporter PHO1 homolog 3-like [Nelumbo nucifera]DAD31321.1 TPA_asm: hypothetical protein HUJ06_010172 [Nelumbo nucifera]